MQLADVIIKYRWPLLVGAVVLFGAGAMVAKHVEYNYSFWTLFVSHDPEVLALKRYQQQWGEDSAVSFLALRSKHGTALTLRNLKIVAQLEKAIADIPGIDEVSSVLSVDTVRGEGDTLEVGPLLPEPPSTAADVELLRQRALGNDLIRGSYVSANGRTTVIVSRIHSELHDAAQRNPIVVRMQELAKELTRGSDLEPYLAGIPVAQWVYSRKMMRDTRVFIGIAAALLAIILVVMFRSLVGLLLPLGVVGMATVLTMATLVLTGEQMNMLNTALPTLMLVIGIADGIHILAHYQQRLGAGDDPRTALRSTVRRLGWAVFLTSATTAVGFASLAMARIGTVRNFGIYAGLGIMYAFVLNLLLVPAGIYVFRNKKLAGLQAARTTDSGLLNRWLQRLGRVVMASPRATLLISAGVVALVGAGATSLRVESRMFEEISDDDPVVIAHRKLEEDLHGAVSYALDVETAPGQASSPAVLKALDRLESIAEAHPAVSLAMGLSDVIKQMNKATHGGDVAYATIPDNPALISQYLLLAEGSLTDRLIDADHSRTQVWMRGPEVVTSVWEGLRKTLEAEARKLAPAVKITVTGGSAMAQRALASIVQDILVSLLGATVVILLLMSALFRSLRLGLLSMVPNLIPLLMTVGVMGYFGINLRTSTVVIFSISLGLAVDDTIHFLVCYRREHRAGTSPREAVLATLRSTGRPIVYTSLLLIGGFWVLLFSSFNATRDVGLLGGVTLISALAADLVVLPAMLAVLPHVAVRREERPILVQKERPAQ